MSGLPSQAEGERGADADAAGRAIAEAPVPAWEDPRRVLARHGLRPQRKFSQNFLVARSVVEAIAAAVVPDPSKNTLVVELGPGAGTLTAALLRRGARVVAVERDRAMIDLLAAELGGQRNLRVVAGDAAALDLAGLLATLEPAGSPAMPGLARSFATLEPARGDVRPVVCGNLPYAITGAILERLVAQRAQLSRAVVMVQKEVRDRLLASPGTREWGALSVYVQAAFDVRGVLRVPAGAFHPPPKVESAVVELVPRAVPRAEETDAFRTIVRAAFGTRRKTLRNGLVRELGHECADALLEATAIDGGRRGETLSIEELGALAAGRIFRG